MRKLSASALLAAIIVSIAIMWIHTRWVFTVAEVSAFLLAAAWLIAAGIAGVRLRFSFLLAPLALAALWVLYQADSGITVYQSRTWDMALYWLANLAFFFASFQTFSEPEARTLFLRGLLWFGIVTAVISTLQELTVNEKIYWLFELKDFARMTVFGPFVYHNQFAAFIELVLPIALYYAFADRQRRILYLFIAAALYAAVIASGSRAGSVLSTAELVWVPLIATRRQREGGKPLLRAVGVLAGMILLLALAAGPDVLLLKFGASDPFVLRREFNISSLAMIKARPLQGFGLGTWPTVYPAYAIIDTGFFANQAHDDWAQWAVEGGLPFAGLILLIALWSIPRGLNSGWGAGIAAIFLHCVVDYPLQKPALAYILFALIAAVSYPFGRSIGRKSGRRVVRDESRAAGD